MGGLWFDPTYPLLIGVDMTTRSHKRRRGNVVSQTTPTFQQLADRYLSGLTSRKEITRRVLAGAPNKASTEVLESFKALESIALGEGWITA